MPIDQDALYKSIGERIKTRRARHGITQIDLARKVGLSRTSIANIEAGQQNAPIHVLYDICLNLGLQPNELLPSMEEIYRTPMEVANAIALEMVSDGTNLSLAANVLSKAARLGSKEANFASPEIQNEGGKKGSESLE